MEKFRGSDIKPFTFGDLKGPATITKGDFKAFSFGELSGESVSRDKVTEDGLRNERNFAAKNNFKIDDIVKDYRGLSRQEQSDLEKRISDEVARRLKAAYEDAFKQGIEEGRETGRAESFGTNQEAITQKIEEFSATLLEVQKQSTQYLEDNKREVIEFVKRFSKWVILKEIDEKVYLENLFEKLVLELNSRKNILVKVGKENFKKMPEIIAVVEAKLGQLQNIRVEVVPEINYPGIILESENGLIDGSLEGVFANIDKIFEQVLKHE